MDLLSQLLMEIFLIVGLITITNMVLKRTLKAALDLKNLWTTERLFKKKTKEVEKLKSYR